MYTSLTCSSVSGPSEWTFTKVSTKKAAFVNIKYYFEREMGQKGEGKSIYKKYAVDLVAAASASFLVSPFITVVDRYELIYIELV
jgi:hypothetical protein